MKLGDLKNLLKEESGQHTTNIFIPSIQRDVPFKPITTADVKTLARIGLLNEFDINNEMVKLALFDKLAVESKETCGIDADSLLPIDFLSFLIGVRKLLNNELAYNFTCKQCNKKFEHKIELEELFNKYIFGFKPMKTSYEKIDNNNNIWRFDLEDFTMKDYLYFRYYIEKLSEIDTNNPDVINEAIYARPILYIKAIYKNEEKVEDWDEHILPDKIQLINLLPSEIMLDSRIKRDSDIIDPKASLSNFISETFGFEKMFREISNMTIQCPHCGQTYGGVFKFDDFFMF